MLDYKQILLEALTQAPLQCNFKSIVDIEPWSNKEYIKFFKVTEQCLGRGGKYFESVEQDKILINDAYNDIMMPDDSCHPYHLLYKGVVAEIVRIRAAQYFKMCAEVHGGTAAEEYEAVSDEKVKKYAADMKKGDKFSLPVVNYCKNIRNQEGRHRVAAAASLGAVFVPCVVIRDLEPGELAKILGFDEGWTIKCGATEISIGAPDRKTFDHVYTVRDIQKVVEKYKEMKAAYESK